MATARDLEEHYLGDGCFVRVDSYGAVWLRAPRELLDHVVCLEPDTLAEFERWLRQLRAPTGRTA